MSALKCRFKHVNKEGLTAMSDATCIVTISVGQEYHEGDRFSAAIDLVQSSFRRYDIMLYDTLQRYTMAINSDKGPDSFYTAATREGDLWLERNQNIFTRYRENILIIRWETWLNHPNFNAKKNEIIYTLAHNREYREVFETTINQFLTRYVKRIKNSSPLDLQRARALCMDYLIEECSALCLWPETDADYEVYPVERNPAMQATHQLFVLPMFPNRLHSLPIKFKKKGQPKPQQFHQLLSSNHPAPPLNKEVLNHASQHH